MAAIATLPETKCTGLLYICSDVVAACDDKAAYLIQHRGNIKVDEATCTSPSEASSFVPWLAPGAPVARVRAVWCVSGGPVHDVFVSPAEMDGATTATSPSVAPIKIISGLTGSVVSLHIFYQSVLAVRTPRQVLFYSLDPSPLATAIATNIGACELPKWVSEAAAEVGLASPACSSGNLEKTICVTCVESGRVFVARVECPSPTSAVVVRRTAMSGMRFSSSPVPDLKETCACKWAVRWSRQEMLMLCFSSVDRIPRLAGLSLHPTKGREMSRWMSPEELAVSVRGASPAAVIASSDICSDSDGAHVWLCDTTTSFSVVLREVTRASSGELVLRGVNADTRVAMVTGANGMFVLLGNTLYAVTSSHMSAASERPSGSAHTSLAPSGLAADMGSTDFSTSLNARMADTALQYATGKVTTFPYILRDSVYVRESGNATCGATFTHGILSTIDKVLGLNPHQRALACIRYSIIARSLHPYTVLELLRVRRGSSAEAVPGVLLAIASTLADKPTLQSGGLLRLPAFEAASVAFFGSTDGTGPFTSEEEKKRYVADVCGAMNAALASGALGAARLLLTVAARAVTLIYGGTRRRHGGAARAHGEGERKCDVIIAECIGIIRSYTDWSLSASSSLGVMTAHVGTPHTLKKEAALRDGGAHPIDTSRQAQIHQMQVLQKPKKLI
ncbi:hypothetical protein LSCM4_01905 [Leishmania orientalis]|uniref:Uncharacterized protein n=1 Tax=Leishmania orientalis TaxID=2249476 RepID=A0A836HDA6_9TRYP|nr:hypothetical protein LSCM4_01905 [Leishmania orientalis]